MTIDDRPTNPIEIEAEHLRMALEVGQAATFVWDCASDRLTWSDYHFKIFGYDERFETNRSAWRDRVHPEDIPKIDRLYETRLIDEREVKVEYRIILPDGSIRWIENRTRCDLDESGKMIRVYGVTFDVTERKTVERERRLREERMRLALEAGHMGVFDNDLVNNVLSWSDEIFPMFGYTQRFTPSRQDWFDRVHPEDLKRVGAALASPPTGRPNDRVEFRIVWPDGSIHWIESLICFEVDESGKPVRIFGIASDIEERKRAEAAIRESEERFRKIADDSPVMLWMCDADFGDTYFNLGWHAFTGTKPGDVFEPGWGDLVHPDDKYTVLEAFRSTAGRREIWRKEYRIRRHDGQYRWILDHGLPRSSSTGEFLGYIGSIVEIHDRKLAQEDLEQRIAERTELLVAANKELEGFTYTVAHDLRAPLRAITSNSRILLEDYEQELPEDAKMLLQRQATAATRMGGLIDDLLEFSRIGRSEMKRNAYDLVAISRHALNDARSDTGAEEVEFRSPESIPVFADAQLIQLVLFNLFSNALKFRKADRPPVIQLEETRVEDERVFVVRDNGLGFEQTYAERIFLPFERLVRNDDYPGTGIGLANVARIVKRHGGRIWAESSLGEGAAFFFTLG